ncbi:MAG: hypothetical protein M3Y87_01380 [Myxococcota bacterium]|nr:hypothetical protein [Myxococcota bacterium]
MRAIAITLAALGLAGCVETGRTYVELPLSGEGVADEPFDAGEWTIDLDRADVAFGPLWLCSTESASPEHCETSILELTETVTIDALDPEARMLATTYGITGTVRSAMWDYGISWLPAAPRPRANEGAPDGHSARFAGEATHPDGRRFAFTSDVDLPPIMQGAIVVRGRRVDAHSVTTDDALVVHVDPRAWWRRVDLDRLAARADAGEDPVVIAPGEADYEALVVAMTASALPSLEWRAP